MIVPLVQLFRGMLTAFSFVATYVALPPTHLPSKFVKLKTTGFHVTFIIYPRKLLIIMSNFKYNCNSKQINYSHCYNIAIHQPWHKQQPLHKYVVNRPIY